MANPAELDLRVSKSVRVQGPSSVRGASLSNRWKAGGPPHTTSAPHPSRPSLLSHASAAAGTRQRQGGSLRLGHCTQVGTAAPSLSYPGISVPATTAPNGSPTWTGQSQRGRHPFHARGQRHNPRRADPQQIERHGEGAEQLRTFSTVPALGSASSSIMQTSRIERSAMKPILFLRIAPVLTLIHRAMHTIGGVFGNPDPESRSHDAVMRANYFHILGVPAVTGVLSRSGPWSNDFPHGRRTSLLAAWVTGEKVPSRVASYPVGVYPGLSDFRGQLLHLFFRRAGHRRDIDCRLPYRCDHYWQASREEHGFLDSRSDA